MEFTDYFSQQVEDPATYRPHYPVALFDFLANLSPAREQAWDCATGNGQAALLLADFFNIVIATDISENQIQKAIPKANITYRVAAAEESGIDDNCVDLITAAQALHWFNVEKFYNEVRRILKPKGIIAAWCYNLPTIQSDIDTIVHHLYYEITKPYRPKNREYLEQHYQTISFPFRRMNAPTFHIEKDFDLNEFLGYLYYAASAQNYILATGQNPIDFIAQQLVDLWGEPNQKKAAHWPIHLLIGICEK